MEDNRDILNLLHKFWSKFSNSNSNQIDWDCLLKGWTNKSKIRRLHTKEFKEYDLEKLNIISTLQKRWNLRCSLVKKTSLAVMLSSQDEDTRAD
jgi:hypothetical protein